MDELRRDAAALAARVAGSLPDASHVGWDASGSIRIELDSGGQVASVEVGGAWRAVIAAERLGAAVMEAIADAATQRLAAWAEALTTTAPPRVDAPPPPALVDPSLVPQLLGLLDEMEDLVAAPPGPLKATGRSAGGHAAVTVRGGDVVAVDLDPHWVGRAEPSEIAAELRTALDSAYTHSHRSHVDPIRQRIDGMIVDWPIS